jgi:hypothetical protein
VSSSLCTTSSADRQFGRSATKVPSTTMSAYQLGAPPTEWSITRGPLFRARGRRSSTCCQQLPSVLAPPRDAVSGAPSRCSSDPRPRCLASSFLVSLFPRSVDKETRVKAPYRSLVPGGATYRTGTLGEAWTGRPRIVDHLVSCLPYSHCARLPRHQGLIGSHRTRCDVLWVLCVTFFLPFTACNSYHFEVCSAKPHLLLKQQRLPTSTPPDLA